MTAVKISLETAPDNYEDMLKLGRFNLRLLAQALGVFSTEQKKSAFMQSKNEEQATELLALVQAQRGGGKKPARQPATSKAGTTRKPSNAAAAAETSEPAEDTRAPVNDPAASRAPATAAVAAGTSKSLELLKTVAERCEGMISHTGNVESALAGLQSSIESLSAAVMFNSALTLMSIEQATAGQMSREDIVSMALEEIPGIKAVLEANAPTDEEYTEEGNE